jgi:hypothetical protein
LVELKALAITNQHADGYPLLGFSLRKRGDETTAFIYDKKALDCGADHTGAREYLGELYVEIGDLPKPVNNSRRSRRCARRVAENARISRMRLPLCQQRRIADNPS